ncbi:hypothetical protein DFH08DRAFT_863435 [Mycena albidolilacea]|uniref:BTB domain-containing protein n=1 Tax=Mycena albidolilacea TaxID=1033008 RepID=A0AAD7A5M9_9AGAR|nr:hypothetical protein DFH08DRAFT_863435 [Mycena albidolilacea]
MDGDDSLRRVEDLWFSNDTLVLRAENRIFRVSKAMLAARSSVFETMFEFPPPASDGDEIMDGSPVVTLHDFAAEVEVFLRAIFNSSYFMPPPSPTDAEVALGILRLSHKYGVDYLHKRAITHLETLYNPDRTIYRTLSSNGQPHHAQTLAFHLQALPVLIEVGAMWLVPLAYYAVGTYDISQLRSAGPPWDSLPTGIRETCLPLAGIQRHAIADISRFLSDICDAANPAYALAQLFLVSSVITRRPTLPYGAQDPLAEWNDGEWAAVEDLCGDCFSSFKAEQAQAFNEVWDALPLNCGLESWDVLLQRRKAVMG